MQHKEMIMTSLKPIQKALESVKRKENQIDRLRNFKKNVSSRSAGDKSLYAEALVVWDSTGNNKSSLPSEIIEMMFPAGDAVIRADACIEKLEAELADLNVLLGAFSKVMDPILKEQEQC
jgi:hypothetical protein